MGPSQPPIGRRFLGALRLVHPFPSVLDGLVVGLVAMLAGGTVDTALRLGVSMTLLQVSIGTLNDIVDAPLDAGRKPGKPLPAGLVPGRVARGIAALAALLGVALALPSGPSLTLLALVVLGIGFAYDLRAKGTALSWLPFALGIPLLPVYGWLGAVGTLPAVFGALVPIAFLAGAALAISNALVDVERDREGGAGSVAIRLGQPRAALATLVLWGLVAVAATATALSAAAPGGWLAAVGGASLVPVLGAILGAAGVRRTSVPWKELAWEVQAVGAGLLAVAWLGAITAAT
jgi:4-hydroxybenzoate polyprenyltransferase